MTDRDMIISVLLYTDSITMHMTEKDMKDQTEFYESRSTRELLLEVMNLYNYYDIEVVKHVENYIRTCF